LVSAARLKMNKEETEALVQRFIGYMREFTRREREACPTLPLRNIQR
jgi:hypothetical protein